MPRNELEVAAIEAAPQAVAIGAPRGWRDDPTSALAAALSGVPLFAGLSKRHLRKIAKVAKTSAFSPGRPIVREGSPGNTFFVILEGRARVVSEGAASVALAELGQGDFFGELALLDGGPRSATVVATTRVEALRLSRTAFRRLVVEEPELGLRVMEDLARRLRQITRALAG